MRTPIRTTTAIASAMVLGHLTGCAVATGELKEFRFDTRKQALGSEIAKRGWIPRELPADATDITVEYNIDDNEQLVTWRGSPLDTTCRAVAGAERRALAGAPDALNRVSAENCLDGYQSAGADAEHQTYWVPAH